MSESLHYSVLLRESVDALVQNPDGVYIDGTFGRGGHARAVLERLSEKGKLLGFDKDPRAIEEGESLRAEDSRFDIVHRSFAEMKDELWQRGDIKVDGVLLDLGVSSPQLDESERGFSFLRDGPLDMRMDSSAGQTAAQWLEKADGWNMVRVFRDYGEERFAKQIARKIMDARELTPITRTLQLAKIVSETIPKKFEEKKHPATRVFQAIRIEINRELSDLQKTLDEVLHLVKPSGRIVIISFHSLEDRIVKRFFRKFSQSQDFPIGVPVTHDMLKAPLKLIGKPFKAGDQELDENVRSRSAVMRVAERTREA